MNKRNSLYTFVFFIISVRLLLRFNIIPFEVTYLLGSNYLINYFVRRSVIENIIQRGLIRTLIINLLPWRLFLCHAVANHNSK